MRRRTSLQSQVDRNTEKLNKKLIKSNLISMQLQYILQYLSIFVSQNLFQIQLVSKLQQRFLPQFNFLRWAILNLGACILILFEMVERTNNSRKKMPYEIPALSSNLATHTYTGAHIHTFAFRPHAVS